MASCGVLASSSVVAPKRDFNSALGLAKESWVLIVRVVHLWKEPDIRKLAIPFSMEMVLMDENVRDRIQASVRKSLIYKFKRTSKQGMVYSISGFSFASNGGSFKATRYQDKLSFQYNTKVDLMDDSFVTASLYAFVHLPEISDDYNTDFLVDVIGLFTAVGTEKEYARNNTPTKMNAIELDSDGFKMECALFGSYVEELNAFLVSGNVAHTVVIVQLAKVKIFKGKLSLQNAMNCTKITFNPTCAEAVEFRQRMSWINDSPSQTISQLQDSSRVSAEEDFLSRKTIMELNDTKEVPYQSQGHG